MNLTQGGSRNLKHLHEFIIKNYGESQYKMELLSRKGVYPYSYVDSVDKFDEQLPPKDKFFNDLTEEHLSDEDYRHVQNVWQEFDLRHLGDLHNL